MHCRAKKIGGWNSQPKRKCQEAPEEDGGGCRQNGAGAKNLRVTFEKNSLQKLVSHLMEAGRVAASDQQMKELLQEVTRLQVFGNLISALGEMERKQIKLKSESVKVR